MASAQAPTYNVVDAGLVRLAELGARLLYLRDRYQPTDTVEQSIIDLRQKLEAIGLSTDEVEILTLKQYVQETYGLLAVYTDPILRPYLPAVSATGAQVRQFVLSDEAGRVIVGNGALIGVDADLVPLPVAVVELADADPPAVPTLPSPILL